MNTEMIQVSKRFGRFEALKTIDLTIEPGEFVAVLGPSGCGKTTLLRLLAGFEAPSSGRILIHGVTVSDENEMLPPEVRNIGMVFQSFALWPHMSVREHLRFPIRYHKYTPAAVRKREAERIDEVLALVGLSELGQRMPNQLSGGQKQRVALARAIVARPSLLLMDEPLSSLDAELRLNMRQEIQNIHRLTQTTIVYVTHDQAEALAMADRIVIMKDGRIEQAGRPETIYSRPSTEFVARFVGKANLVKGKWDGDRFFPGCAAPGITWNGETVAAELRSQGLFPVRPEQFLITPDRPGIPGRIKNVQYQGKEVHYTVAVMDDYYEVHCAALRRYTLDQEVSLQIDLGPEP
ncbi:iron(III) transport system ATP-binding protein [Hydrogenispora ethanolica]|jgi:iron(III) transport system ATP-binding protein|uniref:Iron(III) transport system ATP-binding protein n=1 Tax=Hydrogenispora ethanolica TaxID=1082276 RepID=A0A4R1RKZ8_HYDET|nr:ABC transporter ATP-binding protein [Hydrogenispora ethanolica]TCL66530.1 iron(III) transport system ATP-binding protein [Hydrogenispora ethanolica]